MRIKSETAETKEQFIAEAEQMLKDFGVKDPDVRSGGQIPVLDAGQFRVLDYNIYETTRPGQKALNSLPRKGNERIVNVTYDKPLCNILGCNLISILGLECSRTTEEYVDPEIDFENAPSGITNVTAHLNPLNARITGDVKVSAQNFTEPGKIIERTTFKCSSDTEEDKDIITSSGILDMEASHNIFIDAAEETLDTVQAVTPGVQPEASTYTDVSFEKSGAISTLEGILEIWTTGSTTATVTGEVDVEYEWRNSINTRTFNIETRAVLPVQNLDYGV